MTVREACKILEIGRSKLYQLIAAKTITHYRVGGEIVLRDEDVAAFLSSCRVAAVPTAPVPSKPRLSLKHITLNRNS